VYTPTVGQACEQFSRIYRIPHGLFVAYPDIDRIDHMIANYGAERIQVIVVTDGERILGLGDQGVGGMGIPTGKLALYTACGGLHPRRSLPVFLDVGTNNEKLLNDPLYMGWRHERIGGADYEVFIEKFIDSVVRHYPGAVLQWEDFAAHHSMDLLKKYRDRLPSFNDDIQGTAAVTLATLMSGANSTNTPLEEQTIVIAGAGGAGLGIADEVVRAVTDSGIPADEARLRLLMVDRDGLVHDQMDNLPAHQAPYAQPTERVRSWASQGSHISLLDTVRNANPNVLIGVSGQPGLFTEEIIKETAAATPRPVILPLSNPTSRIEASPADIQSWCEGRALVATGSPYPGVGQLNNVYVFPGIGLGTVAVRATKITDRMMRAASAAVANCAHGDLLPSLGEIRDVSFAVATAVATSALEEGVATVSTDDPEGLVLSHVWEPEYPTFTPGL
ncbi:MAG: oxaloacetate-decarboxylating malate dehydrogenase, partial [Acidimicrobiia bacterium]|nr:oxaloacetate-decarboxylating malate dehydrogenase [Acidimicrobiia bacterium]